MWIEETKNGKYKFVEQYTDYITGKKKRVSVTLEKKTAAAKKIATETLCRMIEERQTMPEEQKDYTLEQLITAYLQYQKLTLKASTYTRNYHQCNFFLKIFDKDTKVNKLTASFLKDTLLKTGKEPGTLNEHRARLLALLRWGYENDFIEDITYLRKFKAFKDKPHREKIQDKYLEKHELAVLLKNMDIKKWRLMTEFLALSGLRIGEAVALDAKDVDFANSCIHVTKTYDVCNDLVDSPKTLCSIRDVYMQPELETVCRNILSNTKLECLARGHRTSLFICNNSGKYINYYSYNKYLREKSNKVLGRGITTHALRHTHASLLLANGMSIDAIARRLGHENSRVTREIYLHVTEQLTAADNAQLKAIKIM